LTPSGDSMASPLSPARNGVVTAKFGSDSAFGGRQFYDDAFLPSQADLNWRNPDLVEAMLFILGYWLDRCREGVRVAIHHFPAA
jgi:glycosidase